MVVLRLHDSWSRFTREVVLLSACDSPTTLAGATVAPATGMLTRATVLLTLQTKWSTHPKWATWEPHWYDVNDAVKASRLAGLSNHATVSAGLGAADNPEQDVRVVRNFLAHRGDATAAKVAALAATFKIAGRMDADRLVHTIVGPGQTLLDKWIMDFRRVAQATCS
jgi:hypothetical protein